MTTTGTSSPGRVLTALLAALCAGGAVRAEPEVHEAYRPVPMPAGFQVIVNELEGPLFADAAGRTLYTWPQHKLRNGYAGEAPGMPGCYDTPTTVTAGLMSPYPAGIALPELNSRPSCTDLWPPVLADDGATEIGDWTLVERRDGRLQWAWEEQPLYTSVRDRQPGDVIGGLRRRGGGDAPAYRLPVGPPPALPPGFAVRSTAVGRMLTTTGKAAVYTHEDDSADNTVCRDDCLRRWQPVLAPALARAQGEWTLLERDPGVLQWVFRGKPLYTHRLDRKSWSQRGSDSPGWRNVFTQPAPAWPAAFTVQATLAGEVLADARGRTIYRYFCGDDSTDQLACDHPEDTQVYRMAMCGAGNAARCLRHWPYVLAEDRAVAPNRSWSILRIDPRSGHLAAAELGDALRVWAYLDRPVYTFGGDDKPGDVNGGGIGEWRGMRNGLRAFWLRDDYMNGILR